MSLLNDFDSSTASKLVEVKKAADTKAKEEMIQQPNFQEFFEKLLEVIKRAAQEGKSDIDINLDDDPPTSLSPIPDRTLLSCMIENGSLTGARTEAIGDNARKLLEQKGFTAEFKWEKAYGDYTYPFMKVSW